ncbi:MAG: DUF4350 domain-containing protein [Bacteroidetes bacterium]|nr:DUF4350 domain-containing protein [Bacteroidota bacterium]
MAFIGACIAAFVMYIQARTPKYKWEPEYSKKSEQPYGLKYFYEMLKDQKKEITSIDGESFDLLDTTKTNSNLIAIDSYIEYDSLNISFLLDYIRRGNKAFISSEEAPTYLLERILSSSVTIYGYDKFSGKTITVNYTSSQLPYPGKIRFQNQYLKAVVSRDWPGYDQSYFNQSIKNQNVVPISYINDTIINCFYISYGKGALIIHSNPILLTNYHLIQKEGFKNTNNLFSYLNNGSIYWSEYQVFQNNNEEGAEKNPLKFLFSHYTLKTAWYVFLFSVFLFIVFRSKREQRIIPVIYKNKNTSIEYAKAIGSLYYQKKSHHNIATELYLIFLSDIRTRYNIATSVKESELIDKISDRAEIKKEVVLDLFKLFSDVKNDVNATSKELIKLYQALENFNHLKK